MLLRDVVLFFFFQAEDGIRYLTVTGVQTCAFFFSSRRRHTRFDCDWSSDVCSSDLHVQDVPGMEVAGFAKAGKFAATTDLSRLREPDVVSICVPTPLSKTDRKSTRLNSSHSQISYAVFCLKKKKTDGVT